MNREPRDCIQLLIFSVTIEVERWILDVGGKMMRDDLYYGREW